MRSKLPEPLEIFVDRALGRKIDQPLAAAGAVVHLHDDYFPQGVEDHVWLSSVGERGWIVLTKDQRIRYRAIEREALLNAGIKAFIFMSGNVPFRDMAQIIANALPAIEKFVRNHNAPFIAGIYKDASVKLILNLTN